MKDELDSTIQQKARELARKITVAHDLDPEIQEELYGHIEDKLLAYKSGEERVSDEDAFILVREHVLATGTGTNGTVPNTEALRRARVPWNPPRSCAGYTRHAFGTVPRFFWAPREFKSAGQSYSEAYRAGRRIRHLVGWA